MSVLTCTISGTLYDLSGTVLAEKEIVFTLNNFLATSSTGEVYVADFDPQRGAVKRIRSASNGAFSVILPQGAIVSIDLRDAGILGKFTVPSSSTAKLSDILNGATYENRFSDLNV